jgi:hypothetical protein
MHTRLTDKTPRYNDEKSLTDKKPTVTEIESKYKGNKGMLCGILEAIMEVFGLDLETECIVMME